MSENRDTDRVILNLSASEAKTLYNEMNRQIDAAGEEGAYDLVPIRNKLKNQLPKFAHAANGQ